MLLFCNFNEYKKMEKKFSQYSEMYNYFIFRMVASVCATVMKKKIYKERKN